MASFSRKLGFSLLFGLSGFAILIGLGIWQLERLQWKEAILAEISARIAAAPVPLPANPDPATDTRLAVTVAGDLPGQQLFVFAPLDGAGYRVIAAMQTDDGRRIMVDLGFVPQDQRAAPYVVENLQVTGNVHWPVEVDGFTPAPEGDVWYARDVTAMASALQTDPVLVIARETTPALPAQPWPVTTDGVKNDHLGYAITWFTLAAAWAAMTAAFVLRGTQSKKKD
ncbi:SURF1 family protein [Ketogulonicigenium vulgare]|uniref:SURF1-like protein n=1 Tax=Ketogulonicigenium vulgare (strain WSH-001) TaxID=759362 RepID=F9Y9G9_KETVW|nr:SURF1 family protein [Ketogulonicigenium vulgare]ADO41927.1 SURF1 protein [Ketogulonicigenium vulgare Y25]AEM40151.1 cytochrome c oxidase assembly protein [Ketogulonicigenium vulgare WSH-001]ALJ80356.1 cytochrome oxidase biogenesis protein Surf1, facilitates heme A insertion [Ketogulonicigenium vulgare]AOZ53850.1 SURF1 protein [Ketogulonicigenium vulgare]